jgi:uncharacterized protein
LILVVADTGPINYLILINEVEVLSRLYDRVVIPQAVLTELTHPNAPKVVADWARSLPNWTEVRSAACVSPVEALGPGEAEAIALARELSATVVLLDEAEARAMALALGIPVAGTVGVLERAAELGLLDLKSAFDRLLRTNFRIAPDLLRSALARDAQRRSEP